MDFDTFEQLALRAVYETDQPITCTFLAYRTCLPSRVVERHLGRMVEQGTFSVVVNAHDVLEYFVPGAQRRPRPDPATPHSGGNRRDLLPLGGSLREGRDWTETSPVMAVCLSVLVPGAGHIYNGRPGAGVAWMASTLMGYACCLLPGVFLHGLCMLSAAHAGFRSRRP